MPSLEKISKQLYSRLIAVGIDKDEARREVELIVEHATALSTAKQVLAANDDVATDAIIRIEAIMEKRCQRIPLQYCLEHTWFMGLRFNVRSGALIPRSDTETLVEVAMEYLSKFEEPTIVDVGTGSGAIAIALASMRKDLKAIALDISPAALEIARENADLNQVSDRVSFIQADWLTFAPQQKLNAVLSNPPYVPASKAAELEPEVGVFEPKEAVFGLGEDGLGFFRSLNEKAADHLLPDGFIAVEVGQGQADEVQGIFGSGKWNDLKTHFDLNKIPRVVSAFRAK